MKRKILDKITRMRKELDDHQKKINESSKLDKVFISAVELSRELRELDEYLYQKKDMLSAEEYDNLTKLVNAIARVNEMQIDRLAKANVDNLIDINTLIKIRK